MYILSWINVQELPSDRYYKNIVPTLVLIVVVVVVVLLLLLLLAVTVVLAMRKMHVLK